MARNEVSRLKITIDIDQATGKILRFNQTLGDTQRKVQQTGQSMSQMQAQTQAAGNTAAASAVNFQTMSQGLLNLSTSAVQTFTSLSNLDRAQNRAKMSVIAVARAEDLLANKQARANDMVAAGTANGEKYKNILREITTATEDLTVKQEKQKIEQDAVNDIYMLFYANIANVGFSTMQTVVAMLGQEKAARLGAVVATKLHTFATWDNIRAARLSATNAKAIAVFWGGAASTGLSLATIKTKLLTGAMTGLKFALGPIGLAMIAITAAWAAYDHVAGGVTAEVKEFSTELDSARAGVDDMTDSMAELTGETKKGTRFDALPHMIAMQKEFEKQLNSTTKEIDKQTKALEEHGSSFPTIAGFSTPSTTVVEGKTKTTAEANIPEWLAAHAQPDPMIVGGGRSIGLGGLTPSQRVLLEDETRPFPNVPQFTGGDPYLNPSAVTRLPYEQIRTQLNTGEMKAHFEEAKKKAENRIITLQDKGESITSGEREELYLLSMEYSQYYKDREINVYTGRSQIISGISQDQMLEDWGKKQSFKYSATGDLREAAGYQVPRGAGDNLLTKVMRGEQLTIDEYFEFQSTIGRRSSYYRRVGEEHFPYGTNTGGGATQAVNTLISHYGLSGQELRNFIGYSGGFKGMNTYKQQIEKITNQRDSKLYENQGFANIGLGITSASGQTRTLGQEDLSRYAERDRFTGSLSENTQVIINAQGQQEVVHTPSGTARRAMAAAQAMGRETWNREQAANRTASSGSINLMHYAPSGDGVTDEDRASFQSMASGYNQSINNISNDVKFGRSREQDLGGMRADAITNAKRLAQSILKRIEIERKTAAEYASMLGISAISALATLRDKSQGEQTLMDMLAYQQRLDAMSSGVV